MGILNLATIDHVAKNSKTQCKLAISFLAIHSGHCQFQKLHCKIHFFLLSAFFRFSLPFLVASFIAVSRCRLILASRNCYFRFIEDARKGRWVAELKEKEMKPQIDALDAETILREAMELAKAYRLPPNLTEAERRELDILIYIAWFESTRKKSYRDPFSH